MFIWLLAAALQTPSTAPPAATPVAPVNVIGPTTEKVALTKPDRVICRSDEHTGTLLTTRTCHTDREWRELEFQSSEWLRQQRALGCSGNNVGVCAGPR